MTAILIFGDSIAHGSWDLEGGWAGRLRKLVDEKIIATKQKFYCMIYNLSVDGNTTEDLLKRVEREIEIRAEEEDMVVVFAVGINDSELIRGHEGPKVSPQRFKSNLGKLIDIARKRPSKIVFIGLTPVDEKKATHLFWMPNTSYRNDFVKEFDSIIEIAAKENGAGFVEVMEHFLEEDYRKLLFDGVHPNAGGHKKIFELVSGFLTKEGII